MGDNSSRKIFLLTKNKGFTRTSALFVCLLVLIVSGCGGGSNPKVKEPLMSVQQSTIMSRLIATSLADVSSLQRTVEKGNEKIIGDKLFDASLWSPTTLGRTVSIVYENDSIANCTVNGELNLDHYSYRISDNTNNVDEEPLVNNEYRLTDGNLVFNNCDENRPDKTISLTKGSLYYNGRPTSSSQGSLIQYTLSGTFSTDSSDGSVVIHDRVSDRSSTFQKGYDLYWKSEDGTKYRIYANEQSSESSNYLSYSVEVTYDGCQISEYCNFRSRLDSSNFYNSGERKNFLSEAVWRADKTSSGIYARARADVAETESGMSINYEYSEIDYVVEASFPSDGEGEGTVKDGALNTLASWKWAPSSCATTITYAVTGETETYTPEYIW